MTNLHGEEVGHLVISEVSPFYFFSASFEGRICTLVQK
jgi:hypothetical protein